MLLHEAILVKKIAVSVQGVMVQLKVVINTMMEKLGQFAKDITHVSQEVGTEGNLGEQALIIDVEGTWRELTAVVNKLTANLTSQVRSIAKAFAPSVRLGLSWSEEGTDHVHELEDETELKAQHFTELTEDGGREH
ncbi:hypothetical protein BYT27DRAFT_7340291 [Phlegmacium glaucopus]|nr:hypothetical protein BYT27DRAFT_7340291 [Phlegmacium glaucopus]